LIFCVFRSWNSCLSNDYELSHGMFPIRMYLLEKRCLVFQRIKDLVLARNPSVLIKSTLALPSLLSLIYTWHWSTKFSSIYKNRKLHFSRLLINLSYFLPHVRINILIWIYLLSWFLEIWVIILYRLYLVSYMD
jgi:hypothetical protein